MKNISALQNDADFLYQLQGLSEINQLHGEKWRDHLQTLSPTFTDSVPFMLRADIVGSRQKIEGTPLATPAYSFV